MSGHRDFRESAMRRSQLRGIPPRVSRDERLAALKRAVDQGLVVSPWDAVPTLVRLGLDEGEALRLARRMMAQ